MDNRVEGDTWSYIGKGLAHASVAGLAAVATTAFVVHGGRVAAGASGVGGLGALTTIGQFSIGASAYAFHQSIDNKPINFIDMTVSGFINTRSPLGSPTPGTFMSSTNMLSPNNLNMLLNQGITSILGTVSLSEIINQVSSHHSSGGGHGYAFTNPNQYPNDPQGICVAPSNTGYSSSNQQSSNIPNSIFNFHY